ncbi:MAG: gliding motility lipoprotein GldD [Cytophagaceae bacterium]|jgi:gliding motility-associated lipoprotein GldD|nr:gliding motility lipoprotein GldD [Cytophagaceae bacterium]
MLNPNPSKVLLLLGTCLCMCLSSCSEDYLPKPKGYNRIDLPVHEYQTLQEDHPYQFEYSRHARILKDSSLIAEPHWIDIYYPRFQSNIQITYKTFKKNDKGFDEHIDDSHKLAYKHDIKAYSIDEVQIKTPKGYSATLFELTGEVPSQFQFYVTDSSRHFLRGAVYFKTATRNDSLAPVIEYMKYDVMKLLNSLEWKN